MKRVTPDSKIYWESVVNAIYIDAGKNLQLSPSNNAVFSEADRKILKQHRALFFSFNAPWLSTKSVIDESKTTTLGCLFNSTTAIVTGYFWTTFRGARATLNLSSHVYRLGLYHFQNSGFICNNMANLITAKCKIDANNYAKARNYFIGTTTIILGAAGGVASRFTKLAVVIQASYVALVAGSLFLLITIGVHWSDGKKNHHLYRSILTLADTVHRQLPYCTDKMEYLDVMVPPHQPLYDLKGEGT